MSYLFLVKASANEFSEMALKPLEIGHFLRNVIMYCACAMEVVCLIM